MKKVRTFTIDRRTWGRGMEGGLLRRRAKDGMAAPGKMCCLGFCALAHGFTTRQIVGKSFLYELNKGDDLLPEWMTESTDVGQLTHVNDSPKYTDEHREERIIAIFAKHGIKVRFTH